MNHITQTVTTQVAIMFILIITGYIMSKRGLITKSGAADMSNILLTLVTPCVLINAYQTDIEYSMIKTLLYSFAASIVLHAVMIVLSTSIYKLQKDTEKRKINTFSAIYSNCGFMGIPLLQASLGSRGVFYGSAYLAIFNCIVWTHGKNMFDKSSGRPDIKKLILNPGIIGTVLAMALYFGNIRLPKFAAMAVDYTAGLNTPLAMLLLGNFLARANAIKAMKNIQIYIVSLLRLILFPLLAVVAFKFINADKSMALALITGISCPTATIAALFAEKFNSDSAYASQIAAITTLFSMITIPLIVRLAALLL